MRMMMKVQIPTGRGNEAIKDGSLPETIMSSVEKLNAEAAYFIAEDGMRTGLFFFEMDDSTGIPPAAEPFFLNLEADITLVPTMNLDEMKAGVGRAMEAA